MTDEHTISFCGALPPLQLAAMSSGMMQAFPKEGVAVAHASRQEQALAA